MNNLMRNVGRKRTRRAFTLIELMVVIIILAVLAALIIPRVVGSTDDAYRSKAVTDIATLESALDRYKLDNDRYPTTEQGLNALYQDPGDAKRWRRYVNKEIPMDPWGNEYVYDSDGNEYTLISYGADGVEGGEGNDADIGGDQVAE